MTLYKKSAAYLADKLKNQDTSLLRSENADTRLEQDILRRCYKRDLGEAIKRYDAARERFRNLETTLRNLKKQEPSEVYMNQRDRRLLDFHFANLEFVSGGTLDKLSLQHFDQDDEFQFTGSHMARVEVTYKSDDTKTTVEGDCAWCAIPLGVLKRSVGNCNEAPKSVLILYSRPFWDVTQITVGHTLNHSKASRGEMFMFTALSKAPVLIAMMAGEAANLETPNEVIVRKAMNVLANIFGSACPKGPVEAVITRWHKDPFASGAYAYIPCGSEGSRRAVLIMRRKRHGGKEQSESDHFLPITWQGSAATNSNEGPRQQVVID
ncbi:hypothetical protein COOONC_10307 [Cooperia oncophora]